MKRRRFISSMALIIPVAATGTGALLSSCNSDVEEPFNQNDLRLLNEIGEVIIPATAGSPGAGSAKVGEFMKIYVTDCYNEDDQKVFIEGIRKIRTLSKKEYGSEFFELTLPQKRDLLIKLDREAKEYAQRKLDNKSLQGNGDAIQAGKALNMKSETGSRHYYSMIKDLVLLGYFTSEPGATKALRYIQTPGYYKGDIAYKKGDKSWA